MGDAACANFHHLPDTTERLRRRQASYAGRRVSDSGDLVRQLRDERSQHLADGR